MRATILGLSLLVVPPTLFAQEGSDSLPFRRGQWAAEFGGGLSLASLGALKFRTPTSAWLLNVNIGAGHAETITGAPVSDVEVQSQAGLTLRVGRRTFTAAGAKIAAFHSLGILAGFTHNATSSSSFGASETNGWSTGFFGDLGGRYLLTPHLGIGVTVAATATYIRTTTRPNFGPKTKGWSLGLAGPSLSFAATVFF